MKSIVKILLTIVAIGVANHADGFIYSDADLLLVFRKDGANDVEFNLGSVSNYLGLANGTVVSVSNWDLNLVRSNFNNSLANVKFLLVAATSTTDGLRRVWSTSASLNPTTPPTDLAGSRWGALRGKISFVGTEATNVTAGSVSSVYNPAPSDTSSYTYIVSDGGQVEGSTIGGLAPFPIEAENPATLLFYEIKISNLSVKPPAPVKGSFMLDAAGVLTFTAGTAQPPPVPQISGIGRSGDTSTISFATAAGVNYRLRSTGTVDGNWTTLPTQVSGDGTTKTLTDTASGPQRFYSVEASR